jgi:hypothetical protein
MRRFAAVSMLASLLVLACTSQDNANNADQKAAEAKTEQPAPGQPPPTVGQPTTPGEPPPTADTALPVPPPEPAPPVAADDYGDEFCATIIPCYQKLEFAGSFTADVSVDIEPDGSVSAVSFTGEAPKPIKSCINDAIKNIKLETYNGKPGRTRCTKSGQLMGGTQMIMSDQTYEVRDPAASKKLEANASTTGKDKGKPGPKQVIKPKGKAG